MVARRDVIKAAPGLMIGSAGMSMTDLLSSMEAEPPPETPVLAPATDSQIRRILEEIERIKKWQGAHAGMDATAAGPDYPHPNMRVRAVQFGEGVGQLNSLGVTFFNPTSQLVAFIRVLTAIAAVDSTYPYMAAYNAGAAGTKWDIGTGSAYPGGSGAGATLVLVQGGGTASHGDLIAAQGTAVASVVVTADSFGADTQYVTITPFLVLSSLGADPTSALPDGSIWYRSDTDKFRGRANGVTVNFAVEGGPQVLPYAAKTGTYTTTATDGLITVDATAGAFTVTLITAVGNTGLRYVFKKITAANTVTIDANGAQTIDGALTQGLSAQWSTLVIVSDGANWLIESRT